MHDCTPLCPAPYLTPESLAVTWLTVGGFGALSLAGLLKGRSEAAAPALKPTADRLIVLFLNGGPSHLDMWDMKPKAGEGIRGEFQPIASSLPGYQVSEHLPKLAKHMHRATIVRSMHHTVNNAHALAVYTAMTGHDRGDANRIVGQGIEDYPSPGAVLSKQRPGSPTIVPQVHLPYLTKEGAGGPPQPGFFGGFLGAKYDPLFVLKDPNQADFSVPELTLQTGLSAERLGVRRKLVAGLDERVRLQDRNGPRSMSAFQNRAFDILSSKETQAAFDIAQEKNATRDAYGRNIYGQSTLLARRLLEAGTRCVTLSWAPDANATWDTHGGNFKKLKGTLLPQFDTACASLIDDLVQRGMFDRTLIAVLGDFGRTPKINGNDGGRDHWNYCYSVMLLGGGFKQGHIYGASDATGAFPAAAATGPGDLLATMYRALGIRHDGLLYDQLTRPHRTVQHGEIVDDLLA